MEQEKTRLLQQNNQLKRIIQVRHQRESKIINVSGSFLKISYESKSVSLCSPKELSGSSPKRRRAEEKDEGIGSPDILEEEKTEDLRREMIELRQQLEKERSVRMILEEQVRQLSAKLLFIICPCS